jgi:hypothetical protein
MSGILAGKFLPAFDYDIAVGRIDFHPETHASGHGFRPALFISVQETQVF